MSISSRIATLLKADIHALLDSVEDPQAMLKQAIRQMEDEVTTEEQEINRREEEKKRLMLIVSELARTLHEIEPKLDLCFDANDERLAKSLLKKRMETEIRKKAIEKQLVATEAEIEKLIFALRYKKDRLQGILDKAALYCAAACEGPEEQVLEYVSDEALEIVYLEEKKKRSAKLEGRAN